MKLAPSEVVFVGNDIVNDVHGAQKLGKETIFSKSKQGLQKKEGLKPEYLIFSFPESLNALRFFEEQRLTISLKQSHSFVLTS